MEKSKNISFRLPVKYTVLLEQELSKEDAESINLLCKQIIIDRFEKSEKPKISIENIAEKELQRLRKKVENLGEITLQGFRFLFREAEVAEEFEEQIIKTEKLREAIDKPQNQSEALYPEDIQTQIDSFNN